MNEAIELLEKQLQGVRNQMQGNRERIDKLNEDVKSGEEVMDVLKDREIRLTAAINKLRN